MMPGQPQGLRRCYCPCGHQQPCPRCQSGIHQPNPPLAEPRPFNSRPIPRRADQP
jgi:hypothetical protein